MKIRLGFVANSSSSSFITNMVGIYMSIQEFVEQFQTIKQNLLKFHNVMVEPFIECEILDLSNEETYYPRSYSEEILTRVIHVDSLACDFQIIISPEKVVYMGIDLQKFILTHMDRSFNDLKQISQKLINELIPDNNTDVEHHYFVESYYDG